MTGLREREDGDEHRVVWMQSAHEVVCRGHAQAQTTNPARCGRGARQAPPCVWRKRRACAAWPRPRARKVTRRVPAAGPARLPPTKSAMKGTAGHQGLRFGSGLRSSRRRAAASRSCLYSMRRRSGPSRRMRSRRGSSTPRRRAARLRAWREATTTGAAVASVSCACASGSHCAAPSWSFGCAGAASATGSVPGAFPPGPDAGGRRGDAARGAPVAPALTPSGIAVRLRASVLAAVALRSSAGLLRLTHQRLSSHAGARRHAVCRRGTTVRCRRRGGPPTARI